MSIWFFFSLLILTEGKSPLSRKDSVMKEPVTETLRSTNKYQYLTQLQICCNFDFKQTIGAKAPLVYSL